MEKQSATEKKSFDMTNPVVFQVDLIMVNEFCLMMMVMMMMIPSYSSERGANGGVDRDHTTKIWSNLGWSMTLFRASIILNQCERE